LPIAHCPLPIAHCPLPIAHCPLAIASVTSQNLILKIRREYYICIN
jgi:hypothetical protein